MKVTVITEAADVLGVVDVPAFERPEQAQPRDVWLHLSYAFTSNETVAFHVAEVRQEDPRVVRQRPLTMAERRLLRDRPNG